MREPQTIFGEKDRKRFEKQFSGTQLKVVNKFFTKNSIIRGSKKNKKKGYPSNLEINYPTPSIKNKKDIKGTKYGRMQ